MLRRPPRSTPLYSSAASDVYKRQGGLQRRRDGRRPLRGAAGNRRGACLLARGSGRPARSREDRAGPALRGAGGGHRHRQAVTSAPRILVATRSRHKLGELRDLLRPRRATLVALDDLGIAEEAEETGATFAANAALK